MSQTGGPSDFESNFVYALCKLGMMLSIGNNIH